MAEATAAPRASLADIYQMIVATARTATAIDPAEALAVLNEIGRMETLMPFTDPTGYRDVADNLADAEGLVRAFLAFRETIERFRPRGEG